MTAEIPYRPRDERETRAWYGLWPEKREELNLAWLQLLPLARAAEARMRRDGLR